MTLAVEVVAHHLRLFGIAATHEARPGGIVVCDVPGVAETAALRAALAAGAVVVAHRPRDGFCAAFGVLRHEDDDSTPVVLRFAAKPDAAWARLRSLHSIHVYEHPSARSVVETVKKRAAWLWLPIARGGILFIGTDLARDLVRYRQGDPTLAGSLASLEMRWGISGERPNYLFEPQRADEPSWIPHADQWSMALADFLAAATGDSPAPILPGGAPGAVVLTGDDDQAHLEKYEAQRALLGNTPITYFLHPLTRHTSKTLRGMRRCRGVDFGIHPDALDTPQTYGEKLLDQCRWYRGLVGEVPYSVRNHGFLNDGYWGHLPHWRREGIVISSNLPGFDGAAINGSFLPARVACDSTLTEHWSLLTAIGDGVAFAGGFNGGAAGDCVHACAERIRQSGIPGVMVLNLHPQNVTETKEMHLAALEVIESGFLAWNLRMCLDWFARRDSEADPPGRRSLRRALEAGWQRITRVAARYAAVSEQSNRP
jgi:hypothetical protein